MTFWAQGSKFEDMMVDARSRRSVVGSLVRFARDCRRAWDSPKGIAGGKMVGEGRFVYKRFKHADSPARSEGCSYG